MTPDLDNTTTDTTIGQAQKETEDKSQRKEETDEYTTREKLGHIVYIARRKNPFSPIETISIIGTYIITLIATGIFGNAYNTLGIIILTSGAMFLTGYIHDKGVINPSNTIQKISYLGLIASAIGLGTWYTLMGIIFSYPL